MLPLPPAFRRPGIGPLAKINRKILTQTQDGYRAQVDAGEMHGLFKDHFVHHA